MVIISVISMIFLTLGGLVLYSIILPEQNRKKSVDNGFWFVLGAGLLVRIISMLCYSGHQGDMSCFASWAELAVSEGFGGFYSADAFTDYPPGYMYVLSVFGLIKKLVPSMSKEAFYFLLKLPSVACDLLTAVIIRRLASEKQSYQSANALAAIYLFMPSVVINSSIWGQVDSILTAIVALMLVFTMKKNFIAAYMLLALGAIFKPQALFYAPVVGFAAIEDIISGDKPRVFAKHLLRAAAAVLAAVVVCVPFGLGNVISQYTETLGSYAYGSVNAYNLWSAMGANWSPLNAGMSLVGYAAIPATLVVSGFMFFKSTSEGTVFSVSAIICICVFMLSVKMHERYLYPALALLVLAFAVGKRKSDYISAILMSAIQFINAAYILFYYDAKTYFSSSQRTVAVVMGVISLGVFLAYIYGVWSEYQTDTPEIKKKQTEIKPITKDRFTKKDVIAIAVITAVYSVFALVNLGDKKHPKQEFCSKRGRLLQSNSPRKHRR